MRHTERQHRRVWAACGLVLLLAVGAAAAPSPTPSPTSKPSPRASVSPGASGGFIRVIGKILSVEAGAFVLEVTEVKKGVGIAPGAKLRLLLRRRTRITEGENKTPGGALQQGMMVQVSGRVERSGTTVAYYANTVRIRKGSK